MTDLPPHLYTKLGIKEGHPPDVVARASAQRTRLQAGGVVPILSLGHLAHLTGASYRYLREIVERVRDPYLDITRLKRDGGLRALSSPEPFLMEVQRWVLHNILPSTKSHPSSYAYQAGRSIVQCAHEHLGAKWLVKLDLHDFFGTIGELSVYRIFTDLGYSRLVSLEMARICTRLPGPRSDHGYNTYSYPTIRSYAVRARGSLPQGAPTSGALANAAALELDQKLAAAASTHGVVYTRYSDDLTFSAGADFDRGRAATLIGHVGSIIREERFAVHKKKTRVVPPGARHVVLGLLLGPTSVQLLPEFKRRIDVHIRGVDRFGLVQHAAHRGFRSIISLVNHVDGCLAFAVGVDSNHAGQARMRWDAALAKSGFLSGGS